MFNLQVMRECWFENTLARLSALRIKKNLTETQVMMVTMTMWMIRMRLKMKMRIAKELFCRRRIAELATSEQVATPPPLRALRGHFRGP